MAVAGNVGEVVVVEVGVLEVISGGVALLGGVEPVVVDGTLSNDVVRPA